MGEDSVKSIAQLVGADIFVVYDMNDIRSSGGYAYEFSLKAYDSTTGQLKSSKVTRSNNLASADSSVGEKQAVNRAMPDVLMQMQRSWQVQVEEGVTTQVILLADFSNMDVILDDVEDLLDDIIDDADGEWDKDLKLRGWNSRRQ